ncbi:electron transfer flavoprotein subunit beta/FixA family protein [Chloroflexota bacterium]
MKQVLDPRSTIKVKGGQILPQEPTPVMVINPRDIAALEEGMRLTEIFGGEVTAISAGDEEVKRTLYYCLARGVDRAIHIFCPRSQDLEVSPLSILISRAIMSVDYDLVLCGDRSQDEGKGLMVPFLANLLGCPQATKVVKLEIIQERNSAIIWRQLERGRRAEIECQLPAVIGVDRTSLESKYVSIFSQRAALVKPVQRVDLEVGEIQEASLHVVEVTPPRPRTKKTFVPDASLSPEERFQLLLSGGVDNKKSKDFIEGATGLVAKQVVDFLKKEGRLPYPKEDIV